MQFAGDYKLESVIVHSASGSMDIKDLILELNVYESIHSSNLYGNLTIMDSANHVQNLPIIGQEDIEFEPAAKSFESAKKDLKAIVADNEREVYSDLLTIRRDKRGALRISKRSK